MTAQRICSRLLPTAYAGLLALSFVGYPLVAATSLAIGEYARSASIAFRAVSLSLSLAVLAMAGVLRLRWSRGAMLVVSVFWLALLVRFMWDLSVVPLPLDLPWDEYLLTVVGVTFVPAVALARLPGIECLDRAAAFLRILGTLAALFVAASVPAVLEDIQKQGRLGFDSLNPISMGHLGVTLVIVSLFAGSRSKTRLHLMFRGLATLLGLALTIASASRGPALALVLVLIAGALARSYRRGGLRRAVLAGFVTLGVIFSIGIAVLQSGRADTLPFIGRIADVASGGDQSVSDRNELMTGALQEFEESPLTGASFVELKMRFYPHNVVVETAMTTGFPGLVVLALILGMSLLACVSLLTSAHTWIALLYLQCLVAAMVSGSLYFDSQFWAITLVVLGARHLLRDFARAPSAAAPLGPPEDSSGMNRLVVP